MNEPIYLELIVFGKNIFPIISPYARPAQALDSSRLITESGIMARSAQDKMLSTADTINIFLGPNSCWRKPPRIAMKMGGNSSNVHYVNTHVSAESPSNTSPNPSEVISEVLEPLDNFSKYPPFPPKNRIVRGVGGVPEFFFGWNPNIFVT